MIALINVAIICINNFHILTKNSVYWEQSWRSTELQGINIAAPRWLLLLAVYFLKIFNRRSKRNGVCFRYKYCAIYRILWESGVGLKICACQESADVMMIIWIIWIGIYSGYLVIDNGDLKVVYDSNEWSQGVSILL